MRKLLLISTASSMLFISCKKDYTCVCTSTVTVGSVNTSSSASTTYHDTKSGATASCTKSSSSTTVGNVSTTESCSIK